jgi:hypothetical protein
MGPNRTGSFTLECYGRPDLPNLLSENRNAAAGRCISVQKPIHGQTRLTTLLADLAT